MAYTINEVKEYILENKSLVLATVDPDGNPQVRHLGGYALDGNDILFFTTKGTEKINDIAHNPNVTILFQHEGQQVPRNITIYGEARALDEEEAKEAAGIIQGRRPQIKYDPSFAVIFKVTTKLIKILDFASVEKTQIIQID